MIDAKWPSWLVAMALFSLLPLQACGPGAGSVFRDCPDCPEMVVIPAGAFLMGSQPNQQDPAGKVAAWQPSAHEQPRHPVTLKSFALGKYEVTQEQWTAVMGDNPSQAKGRTLPVERVSWDDVQAFLQRLNAKTGKNYRLPTESEWEYAARAGGKAAFSFANEAEQYAWFMENLGGRTHPVGENAANDFGLHDMHGNVWEWVQDCFRENYLGAPADGSAAAEQEGCYRVNRGGSWNFKLEDDRSANRSWYLPGDRDQYLGFRLAKSLP